MAAGNPQGLADWNNRAGQLAVSARELVHQIQTFELELSACPDATLLALGMVQDDINNMRSGITDLNDWAGIFQAIASTHLTGTYNYATFLKLLYGVQ